MRLREAPVLGFHCLGAHERWCLSKETGKWTPRLSEFRSMTGFRFGESRYVRFRDCNLRVAATGGEWVGDALANLSRQVLCGACYDLAKVFHIGSDPRS